MSKAGISRMMLKPLPPFLLFLAPIALSASEKLDFNRDVRPILSNTCFQCHGFDKAERKADLRLDDREAAIESGVIVPGDADASEIIYRIHIDPTDDEDDELMPPADIHKPLTDRDREILTQWVNEGAEYAPHWAYVAPVRPDLPENAQPDSIKTAIDNFVAARQDDVGMEFSPEADPATLARRLSLDLTGLPPEPERVEEFVNAHSADADQAVSDYIDQLLASPHFGERLAVPYLDMVRFADTVGYHGDQNQRIFPYRDYVIEAFNKNKPYDEFITEQLAGDLLPEAGTEQLVATGFNRLNMMTREGGAQPKEYLAKYQGDRVRAVSTAFLGSTMACCECHDHKFDPFSIKDFYAMGAYFADVKQWGVYSDYRYTPNPDLKGFNNNYPFPPEIVVESPYLKDKAAGLWKEFTNLAELSDLKPTAEAASGDWHAITPDTITAEKGTPVEKKDDNIIQLRGDPQEGEVFTFEIPAQEFLVATVKIEVLATELNKNRTARGKASNAQIDLTTPNPHGKKDKDGFIAGIASGGSTTGYTNGRPFSVIEKGWQFGADEEVSEGGDLSIVYHLKRPTSGAFELKLHSDAINAFRISVSPLLTHGIEPSDSAISPETNAKIAQLLASSDTPADLRRHANALRSKIAMLDEGKAYTLVTERLEKPMTTRVLARGNWQDDSGEILQPSAPTFLGGEPSETATRLDLARWITDPENPLTARHFVNVLWAQFFGHGISRTVEDLGNQGEWPTHPKLLDWLAVEFVESGWDVKHLVRLMVNSRSYRQSSDGSRSLAERDPDNRLYARQSPRRLDAEFVRDNALAISGLLEEGIGGPSASPYQPAGYYVNLNFPERKYKNSDDVEQYRRGLYTHWQRTFLNPMLANFDAPSREECTVSRPHSNTPQQALTLLNDPSFVEAARTLAASVAQEGSTFDSQLDTVFNRALSRTPRDDERNYLHAHYVRQLIHYQENREDAAKLLATGNSPTPEGDLAQLAALTSVTRIILNLHETITRL